jgi:hypothetical protein
MAKPLRYGPTIGVRLPLELHDRIISDVGIDEIGPWIRDLVVNSMESLDQRVVAQRGPIVITEGRILGVGIGPGGGESTELLECEHTAHDVIAGGLHRCKRCGAIRGKDKIWRQA